MRKTWLIFSQAVTVAVAVLFVVATLKPDWLRRNAAVPPVVSVLQAPADTRAALPGPSSYAGASRSVGRHSPSGMSAAN